MKKKIVKIKNGDEFMAAAADVSATPYGNVGQHIHYVVGSDALKNSKYFEDLELRMAVNHFKARPNRRLDISAVADNGYSPVVGSGKWNYEKGIMEHPSGINGKREIDIPAIPKFGYWSFVFAFIVVAWVPFLFILENLLGRIMAIEFYCYPILFFMLLTGISQLVYSFREE